MLNCHENEVHYFEVILLGDQGISLISFHQIVFMKKILSFLFLSLIHLQLNATIKLPMILSDNMVLQQKSVVKIWGTSTTKKNITVRVSWTNTLFSCKAKPDGSWELSLFTPKGTFEKQSIIISDGTPLTLKNVLIGEVWLCAGQSNMAMTFSGYRNQPIQNAKNEMEAAEEESGTTVRGKSHVAGAHRQHGRTLGVEVALESRRAHLLDPVGLLICPDLFPLVIETGELGTELKKYDLPVTQRDVPVVDAPLLAVCPERLPRGQIHRHHLGAEQRALRDLLVRAFDVLEHLLLRKWRS